MEQGTSTSRKNALRELFEWIKYLGVAVLIGIGLTTFVVQRNEVMGSSMDPTLKNGDQIVVQKLSRYWHGIDYGDIVTIHGSSVPGSEGTMDEDIIKRIIGCPGDHIQIMDNHVYLNDKLLEEPYLLSGTETVQINEKWLDVKLGEDEYYVLGDNRNASRDSRDFGPVPHDAIIGELWFRMFPFEHCGGVE
ncbi:MAG: signal peptidase I [Fastidiosipilaceae bacterium]|nr:signal peptidase I [Clostridiaceae bacterium]